MSTICIMPCGNKKIWDKNPDAGPTKARYVYVGSFTSKCQEYAEKFYPESWCILSAKYGFLFPDDIVPGQYDKCFNNKKSHPITIEELKASEAIPEMDKYDNFVVLGGKNYTEVVKNIFTDKNVYNPLSKCKGMGFMMQELNEAIKKNVPL